MSRYLDSGSRVLSIVAGGHPIDLRYWRSCVQASLDLSTTQTSQLTMTFADPGLGWWRAHNPFLKRTAIDYGGLRLEVASRETVTVGRGTPGYKIVARARGVQALRRAKGAHTWNGTSYAAVAETAAADAGLQAVIQPSPVVPTIERKGDDGKSGDRAESTWDVLTRGARVLGYWLFEDGGILCYGSPSWLLRHRPSLVLQWQAPGTTRGLLGMPQVRDSDDNDDGITGSVDLAAPVAELIVPGTVITLFGLGGVAPGFQRQYLSTSLRLDLDGVSPGQVQFSQIIDPEPQPETVKK